MNVAIYLPLIPHGGSLKNLLELLSDWQDRPGRRLLIAPAQAYELLCELGGPAMQSVGHVRLEQSQARGFGRIRFEMHRGAQLIDVLGADIVFAPGGTLPRNLKTPSVAVFQNVLPLQQHLWRLTRDVGLYVRQRALRWRLIESARQATVAVFNSQTSRDLFQSILGQPVARSLVIQRSAGGARPDLLGARKTLAHNSIEQPYLVAVGQIFRYRNFGPLIEAYGLWNRAGGRSPLVIVGKFSSKQETARLHALAAKLGLGDKVRFVGDVPARTALGLMKLSQAHLFTSEVENCPNALIEGLELGVPTVALRASANPEFGGDAPVWVNSMDPKAWQGALELVTTSNPQRVPAFKQATNPPDPQETARLTWQALANASERDGLGAQPPTLDRFQ